MSDKLSSDLASLRIDRSAPKGPNRVLRGLIALALVGALG
jgi:hypothetical protein